MTKIRFLIPLLLIGLFLPATLAAQYGNGDSGQYVILNAQYGTARNHVDVTQRLKEVARHDTTFRMGNSTFGTDPDPGQVKTLRIYARGPNGNERMFEYREGSTVDGSMFRSWGRGEWANERWNGGWEGSTGGGYGPGDGRDSGQFVILSAQYGTERRHVDVTNRLKELARRDLVFRMGNSTFGVDPDPGVVKVLRIYARGPNGGERMFEYVEGSTVDGNQFTGWRNGNWGGGGWSGNWGGGGGYGGGYDRDEGAFTIISAQYGTKHRHVDVTNRLKELARNDRVFRMGNSSFGVDPDPGRVKVLRIYARGPRGREQMFEYREGSTVDGTKFRGWGRGEWGNERWSGRWEGQER
jgi:hypothetical protein